MCQAITCPQCNKVHVLDEGQTLRRCSCGWFNDPRQLELPLPRDPLLVEREKTHGDFAQNAMVAQGIKTIFEAHGYHTKLSYRQAEALDLIASKIGRIIAGDHNFKEHYIDIAGYAKLGAEACD